MLALLSGGLILAGVVARVIAGRVAAPLDDMAAAAERVQAESLSKRLTVSSPAYDEVLRLATAFNQMLERLEGAVGRLRRFTADAAHELRTPLAGLKAQVQAALAAQPERDHAQATLQALLPEVNRLAELIERLLVLSRVDDRSVEREPIDFSDLVVERVERARGAADRAEVNLAMEITNPVQLRGDAVLLRQLADNLIDNAIKYTPAGGRVQVTLQSGGPTATLRVVDCGVGIAPAALPHIFERFYREDSSRARATGGVGLGLAIVTCVVEAHGGTVRVESEPGRGAIFEVVLPT
jgi:heavy metal sensor kinase